VCVASVVFGLFAYVLMVLWCGGFFVCCLCWCCLLCGSVFGLRLMVWVWFFGL